MDDTIDDMSNFVEMVHQQHPTLPVFLFGGSLGGLITCRVSLLKDYIQGMILMAPALAPNEDYEKCLRRVVKCLNCICPCLPLKAMERDGVANKHPDAEEDFWNDPLTYQGKVNARTGAELIYAMEGFRSHVHAINTPFILVQGGLDKMVGEKQSREFFDAVTVQDKTWLYKENSWHAVLNEPEIEEIVEELQQWVMKRAGVQQINDQIDVMLVGLDNSGKSSIVNSLKAVPQSEVVPTMGYCMETLQIYNEVFSVRDMAGDSRYRDLWEVHSKDVQAIIFVIDCSDIQRIPIARNELQLLLSFPHVQQKQTPILLFANKTDKQNSISIEEVRKYMELDDIDNNPWHIQACSGVTREGIQDGFKWLLQTLN